MLKELCYPFDDELIMRKKKRFKRELLSGETNFLDKRIAVLGGSTTHQIIEMLELFLLNLGIRPTFYESVYAQYWQDAVLGNEKLDRFRPELIFVHTSNRNIRRFPSLSSSEREIEALINVQYCGFLEMWDRLAERFKAPIIQNNFELPAYRLLGNKDVSDIRGRTHHISKLNQMFYEYAQQHNNFYINDIAYLSAAYGLERWSEPLAWHMYKCAMSLSAIPAFSFNVANIIKSIYGKNKKALVLDLDNTLWGGVIGDDGPEGIELGQESSSGQVYSEFQEYIKAHKALGVMLCVNSKNEYENALLGLNHENGTLSPEDFVCIKANWQNKDMNITEIAGEMNILPESLVFVDDNPFERALVAGNTAAAVPEMGIPEDYIRILDRSGFFEITLVSEDDLARNEMYAANIKRQNAATTFADYESYLASLDMEAEISRLKEGNIQRVTQLANKSNQFNLTTKRYTAAEMEEITKDKTRIAIFGRLKDSYGDNGIVSVVIGRIEKESVHIELWLMSCRVLKRDMELAMLDEFVRRARKNGANRLVGYYIKSAKNAMVQDFYPKLGFSAFGENDGDDTVWELDISNYKNKSKYIKLI